MNAFTLVTSIQSGLTLNTFVKPIHTTTICRGLLLSRSAQLTPGHDCVAHRSHNNYNGDRCLATAGPCVWNSLPHQLRPQDISLNRFETLLKTFCSNDWDFGALWDCDLSLKAPYRYAYLLTCLLTYLRCDRLCNPLHRVNGTSVLCFHWTSVNIIRRRLTSTVTDPVVDVRLRNRPVRGKICLLEGILRISSKCTTTLPSSSPKTFIFRNQSANRPINQSETQRIKIKSDA